MAWPPSNRAVGYLVTNTDWNDVAAALSLWGGNVDAGAYNLTNVSQISVKGATSGSTAIAASAAASGTLTLPAATDTLVGKATTDTLTNKTFDTAGSGNVFKINGTGVTDVTGSGSVVLSTSPTLTTPTIVTSAVAPLINGGTSASSTLVLQSTSGSGTSDSITFKTGSQSQRMKIDTNGNVSIGSSPAYHPVDVTLSSGVWELLRIQNLSSGAAALYRANGGGGGSVDFGSDYTASTFILRTAGVERIRVTDVGNMKIGGTAERATTTGTYHLDIFNGTAPAGTLANGISIYSSSGEAYVMDATGNSTLFSPHDRETNEWIFDSTDTRTGKRLKIDVEKLLRFVNEHFGLDCVHDLVKEAQ